VAADAVDAGAVAGQRAGADLPRRDGVEPERHPLLDGEPSATGEHDAGVTLSHQLSHPAGDVGALERSHVTSVALTALLQPHGHVAVPASVCPMVDAALAGRLSVSGHGVCLRSRDATSVDALEDRK
jgi:hypothetical protein